MAKKDISKFRKAMLSKTNIIKDEEKEEPEKSSEETSSKEAVQDTDGVKINKQIEARIDELCEKHGLLKKDVINIALRFFLEYEEELFSKPKE